jgi:hypothetical protein
MNLMRQSYSPEEIKAGLEAMEKIIREREKA